MKTLVLGMGNPILSDDAVGIRIAEGLKQAAPDLDVVATSEAGLSLLEYVVGYDRLVIIDSIMTRQGEPGALYRLEVGELGGEFCLSSSHGVDIGTAITLGERLGYEMPGQVSIYAVEISDNTTFSERCTARVEQSLPGIISRIVEEERL